MITKKYPENKQYTFGCVVTVYNRAELLEQTLANLANSFIPKDLLFIFIDDGSRPNLDIKFKHDHIIVRKERNYGVSHSLVMGWDLLYNLKIPYMLNLDSDVLVARNWLSSLLNVHELQNEQAIVTGFNGKNHPVKKDCKYFLLKNSIGGINLFFKRSLYPVIREALTVSSEIPKTTEEVLRFIDQYGKNPQLHPVYKGWDWGLMNLCDRKNIQKICTKPSVVQHVGNVGLTSSPQRFEQCSDFEDLAVPKIIHQTWKTTNIPEHLKWMQDSVISKHQDFEYKFWTDHQIDLFIKKEFPEFWGFYNSFPYIIQKIDFARLLMVYHFGGVYLDLDSFCYKNLGEVLKYPLSLVKTPKDEIFLKPYSFVLNNAFIAGEKHNFFIKKMIDKVVNYKQLKDYQNIAEGRSEYTHILHSTGPLMVTDVFLDYSLPSMINLVEEDYFFGVTKKGESVLDIVKAHQDKGHSFIHIHESSWWLNVNRTVVPTTNHARPVFAIANFIQRFTGLPLARWLDPVVVSRIVCRVKDILRPIYRVLKKNRFFDGTNQSW